MMKKKFLNKPYRIVVLTIISLLVFSCGEEFYNQPAGDRITPDQNFKSTIDVMNSTLGSITPLQVGMPNLILLDGLRSDMMEVTSNADGYMTEINNQIFTRGNPYTDPSSFYKVIININEVLLHIDEVQKVDRTFEDLLLESYKGGLIAMRSWVYLTLVRLFNEVAYVSDNMVEIPIDGKQMMVQKDAMLDTLINQLLPYVFDGTANQKIELRVGYLVNTKAMLGEIYLEKKDYTNAAKYLKLACESYLNSGLKVSTFKQEFWASIFYIAQDDATSFAPLETISIVPFSANAKQSNPLTNWTAYNYMVKPTSVLVDSFLTQKATANKIGDEYRQMGTFYMYPIEQLNDLTFIYEPHIVKYVLDPAGPFNTDIIISRAGGLHLLLAEAYNRMGDETSQNFALMLLNNGVNEVNPKPPSFTKWSKNLGIRGRVGLLPKIVPAGVSGEEKIRMIEDFIIQERAMELAFEGQRWFDLVRVAERRGEPEFLADKVAAKFKGTGKYDEIRNKLMNPANWYLKIN